MLYILDSLDWWQWEDLNIPESAYYTKPYYNNPQLLIVDIHDVTYSTFVFNHTPDFLEPLWIH